MYLLPNAGTLTGRFLSPSTLLDARKVVRPAAGARLGGRPTQEDYQGRGQVRSGLALLRVRFYHAPMNAWYSTICLVVSIILRCLHCCCRYASTHLAPMPSIVIPEKNYTSNKLSALPLTLFRTDTSCSSRAKTRQSTIRR